MSMPDPVMVLCVDGPTRGRLRAVTGSSKTRFHAYDMPPISPSTRDSSYADMSSSVLTYHVHQIRLLGFVTSIASMQIDQNKIDPYDIIEALFNETGRQATYRIS
jgi:hypothetical protein